MAVHQIETMDVYVRYLQQTPVEVEALFRDLLIGVTNFFRDSEAFKALEEQIIPKLREAEVALARGATVGQACKKLGVTEQTYYRWRMEYGGLRLD